MPFYFSLAATSKKPTQRFSRTVLPYRKYAEMVGEIVTADPNPTIEGLVAALAAGNAQRRYPIGTVIPDEWGNISNPLIVSTYRDIETRDGATKLGAGCIRTYTGATNCEWRTNATSFTASGVFIYMQNQYLEKCSQAALNNVVSRKLPGLTASMKFFPLSTSELGGSGSKSTWEIFTQRGLTSTTNGASDARRIDHTSWTRTSFTNAGAWLWIPSGELKGDYSLYNHYAVLAACFFTAP